MAISRSCSHLFRLQLSTRRRRAVGLPRLGFASLGAIAFLAGCSRPAATPEPLSYTVRIEEPAARLARIELVVPAGGRESLELMLPIWSPGYYRVEDYAARVRDLEARAPDGTSLEVERTRPNRWLITTGGAAMVRVSYQLFADQRSVTTNWVGEDLALLNGGASFLTLIDDSPRPHEIRLELPPGWQLATGLPAISGATPHRYRAADYEMLVDSPILMGELDIHEFEVEGTRHFLVSAGDLGEWDGARVARDLAEIVAATRRFWGSLPFENYHFLNLFRPGGGGLEHMNSTILTSNAARLSMPESYRTWLEFVSHEYFHSFNVKRLRPVELGPFDYEAPPSTESLWISEGLTTYFGDLMVVHAGLATPEDFLANLSGHIRQLQNSPGRLRQSLAEASLDVWTSGVSGVGRDPNTTVSYYTKGPIVGFLLDARIQRLTGGERGLSDLIRLAYQRYSGEHGFTPADFRATAEEVAGADLGEWFRHNIYSTEELDYSEALDWFGLGFGAAGSPVDSPAGNWRLELRADATEPQIARLSRLLGG